MNEPEKGPEDTLVDVPLDLDDEQLAQIDALIEEHSTPSHRLTREEVLHTLLEQGCEQVEKGESLLPYLVLSEEDTADGAASFSDPRLTSPSAPPSDSKIKH
ncbi:MAG: hypothetical protein ABJE95_21600 [Byssovorax sp.]